MAKHVRGMSAGHENESGDNHVTPKLPQKVNRSITWRELCYFIAIGCKMLHGLLYNDEAETPSAVEMTWRWESAIATLAIPGNVSVRLNCCMIYSFVKKLLGTPHVDPFEGCDTIYTEKNISKTMNQT